MKAEIITSNFDLPEEIALLSKQINGKLLHVACPALTGDSMSMKLLLSAFDTHQAASFINRVNLKKETGCFHPRLSMSIYPVMQKGLNAEEMIEKIVNDLFTANEDFLKTETLLVISEPEAGYNQDVFLKCLNEMLERPAISFIHLKNVLYKAIS